MSETPRWTVFCALCGDTWTVAYPHPGKSVCAPCEGKFSGQQRELAATKAKLREAQAALRGIIEYFSEDNDMTNAEWECNHKAAIDAAREGK